MESLSRVLIVDDEPYLRAFLKSLLEPQFDVRTAEGGAEALALTDESLDVILIDVMMPGMSGIDLCRELRAKRFDVPIIMLTGLDDPETRASCAHAGADDLLLKPFRPDQLVTCITRCLDA